MAASRSIVSGYRLTRLISRRPAHSAGHDPVPSFRACERWSEPAVPRLVVPCQGLGHRLVRRIPRQADRRAIQLVVVPAILELFLDPPADFEVVVRSDRYVAGVEELVD